MTSMKEALIALWKDEEGLEMVEYAVAGALIAAAAAVAYAALSGAISAELTKLSGIITTGTAG